MLGYWLLPLPTIDPIVVGSAIVQALQANPALRARLAAENRARLRRYLLPDDPLQLLLHGEDDDLSSDTALSGELDRVQLHPTTGIELEPAECGMVGVGGKP